MKKNEKAISFFAAAEVEQYLYFSAWRKNGLFRMDRSTKKIFYIGRVWEETREVNLHRFAFHYHDCIYFIPCYADYIAKLHLSNLEISVIKIPERRGSRLLCKFASTVLVDRELWLIPYAYGALLKIDLDTDEIAVFDNWPSEVYESQKFTAIFCSGICVSNYLCICPSEGKYFITFNLNNKEMECWKWNYPENAFFKMMLRENVIWFLPARNYPYIIGFSLKTREKFRIMVNKDVDSNIMSMYSDAIAIGNYIVSLPYQSDHWLILNVKTHEVMKEKVKFKKDGEEIFPRYQAANYFGSGFIATKDVDEEGLCFVQDGSGAETIRLVMDQEAINAYVRDVIFHSGDDKGNKIKYCLVENVDMNLLVYSQVLRREEGGDNVPEEKEKYGHKIYQEVR